MRVRGRLVFPVRSLKSLYSAFPRLRRSPFAPHLGEELWQFLGHDKSLAYEPWPKFDPSALVEDEIEIPVQVMGKLRGRVKVPVAATPAEMEAAAKQNADVAKFLEGKTIVKVVAVPKRMVNFVVR